MTPSAEHASMVFRACRQVMMAFCYLFAGVLQADVVPREVVEQQLLVPYVLGDYREEGQYFDLLDAQSKPVGYAFQSEALAPLPGFSGAAINTLVLMDQQGQFIDTRLLQQNEPIFVSGLGVEPLRQFLGQYPGLSLFQPITVGSGSDGAKMVYLDGVTKATASVRIAHESVIGAGRKVWQHATGAVASLPIKPSDGFTQTAWATLVEQGIARNFTVSNADIQALFADTIWEGDDPEALASPDEQFIDLWVVDLGHPAVAASVLSTESNAELQNLLTVFTADHPILLIERARHGLLSPEFIRNTAPKWVNLKQGDLPLDLRDADVLLEFANDVPQGTALLVRTDRRIGFDPLSPWTIELITERAHGSFMPQIGAQQAKFEFAPVQGLYEPITPDNEMPQWQKALLDRWVNVALVLLGCLGIGWVLWRKPFYRLGGLQRWRMGILLAVLIGLGWVSQGQLSIVTVLGVFRALASGSDLAFLGYDPISAVVWIASILGALYWGRALFCGWLCPFGALQELVYRATAKLPKWRVPAKVDRWLRHMRYVVLLGLFAVAFWLPQWLDRAVEIEPFKTAITVFFVRDVVWVAYALFWVVLAAFLFKPFCRYLCPLGAL
ncbi:MAG: 4Fe-4S binding protein, partial [Gammaproteobacteria bacterium]|nr:4Fe-4S binding protein [Gammaproteobacteria bacterium]